MSLELLSAYLSEDLSPEETARLEVDLASDPLRAEELDAMRTLTDHLSTLDEIPPPDGLDESVLSAASAGAGLGLGTWLLGIALIGAAGVGAYTLLDSPDPSGDATAPAMVGEPDKPVPEVLEPPPSADTPDVREVVARSLAFTPARGGCEDLGSYEAAALGGTLDLPAIACLERVRAADDSEEAAMASLLLMQDAWVKEDKDTWRALAEDHVSALDPSYAPLWAKLALEASRMGDHAFALSTATEGLAAADAWPDAIRDRHMASMHKVRVSSLIALETPADELAPAVEAWHAHVAEAGLDASQVERVCEVYALSCAP